MRKIVPIALFTVFGGVSLAAVAAILASPPAAFAVTITKDVVVKGDADVTGTISKGSGTFLIDHPLDPRNKLLYHSFVESPDAKNVYDGIATLDENGEAVIMLPDYFDALNTGIRYQLESAGTPMPHLHVKEEAAGNRFVVAGGEPGGKVSWQVTGIRKDRFILDNPIIVEVEKGPGQPVNKGECIYEPACEGWSWRTLIPFL